MENARETDNRKLAGRGMSAALAIRDELTREIPRILQTTPQTAKIIALRVGVTPRCVEGIREQQHAPSAHVLLALAKQYPAVKQLVLRLMDCVPGEDARLVSEIANMIARAGK